MIQINQALNLSIQKLYAYSDSPRIDAEILLAKALLKTRTYLYAYPEAKLTAEEEACFTILINKRREGTPIAYLTGMREFWSLNLHVNHSTLIPRAETEKLVEVVLSKVKLNNAYILDLGTGSGAIALALAHERPDWQIKAIDFSQEALNTAMHNASSLGLFNVDFIKSDWFSALPVTDIYEKSKNTFDAIVSNPPYIPDNDPHLFKGDLRFEPTMALISGPKGLNALKHIIQQSILRLKTNGWLLLEHGFEQSSVVISMLHDYGYTKVQSFKDLGGLDRVSIGKRSKT